MMADGVRQLAVRFNAFHAASVDDAGGVQQQHDAAASSCAMLVVMIFEVDVMHRSQLGSTRSIKYLGLRR